MGLTVADSCDIWRLTMRRDKPSGTGWELGMQNVMRDAVTSLQVTVTITSNLTQTTQTTSALFVPSATSRFAMNRRKGAAPPSALAPPPDPLAPNPPSSPAVSLRSASPSSGLAHLFAKPKSWFVRSASASKAPPSSTGPAAASGEGRSGNAAGGARKHKISRPTDPRPILAGSR